MSARLNPADGAAEVPLSGSRASIFCRMNLNPERESPPPGKALKLSTRPKAAVPSAPTTASIAVRVLNSKPLVLGSIVAPPTRWLCPKGRSAAENQAPSSGCGGKLQDRVCVVKGGESD